MLNCGMVRFPTGHYWLCSWPVKKTSPGMCLCKWSTFWTPLVNKLLHTISIFHVFLVQVGSIHRVSFLLCWCLMVNRPTMLNCKALSLLRTVNKPKSKLLIFCMVLILALILTTFGSFFICWIDVKKSHLKRVLHAWKLQISDFKVFQGNAATYFRCGGNLILVLLEIYCSLHQWKNFANRSRIDKVIAMIRVAPFFDSQYMGLCVRP